MCIRDRLTVSVWQSLINSLMTGAAATAIALTLGLLVSYVLSRRPVSARGRRTLRTVDALSLIHILVNQLVLTKDAPLADVVFGIDNTFAGRAVDAGVLTPYSSPALPADAAALAADDRNSLTPVDYGDVCLNADTAWFKAHKIAVPETLDDLLKPEYKDQLVVANPASSSPGLAFQMCIRDRLRPARTTPLG